MKMTRFDIFSKATYHIDNMIEKNYRIADKSNMKDDGNIFDEAILSISKKRNFLSYSIVEAIRRSGKLKNFTNKELTEERNLLDNEIMEKLSPFSVFRNIR
jgi:hypothetical protein